MDTISSAIKQLDHIRELLTHPAIDQQDIFRRVRKLFIEIRYQRHPYIFRLPSLCRAASKENESWFNDDIGQPDPDKLHCVPMKYCTLQRCNWAGEPVFYGSTENGVPVFEVRAELGHTVVISVWRDKRNVGRETPYLIEFNAIALGVQHLVDMLPADDTYRELLLQDDLFKAKTPAVIRAVDAYIGELFIQPSAAVEKLYWFTSAIARSLFNDLRDPDTHQRLPGLIYPSVESKFTGFNIALREDFARTHLKLYGASMYQVLEHDPLLSTYNLKPLKWLKRDKESGLRVWEKVHSKHNDARFLLSPQTPAVKELHLLSDDE